MKKKHIHFVGIKGVGMAPLAIIAKEAKCIVTGSDISDEFITDKSLKKVGIEPFVGFSKDHITKKIDLVITTGAHGGFDNEEVKAAKDLGITVITQAEAVGLFMKGTIFNRSFSGITVTGTHGKTTTTAMVATILKHAHTDPSYLIGTGSISSLGLPGHFGKGKYFIAEGDEYVTEPQYDKTTKFLWQHPEIAIFTNIEYDHTDIYTSVDEIRKAFLQFARNLSSQGILIANGDDRQTQILLKEYQGNVITYGTGPQNNYVIKKISASGPKTFFWLECASASLGEFCINVIGDYNAMNAAAAIIAAIECGIPLELIRSSVPMYHGSERRSELVGTTPEGASVYDDYAHHPTEIKKTLSAFRTYFPKENIVCIFQPHMYSRTKKLFEEFIHSFSSANTVILTDIYPSLREQPDPQVSSRILAESLKRFHKDVIYCSDLPAVVEYITQKRYGPNTIIISMGAGDVYKISEKLKVKS